MRNFILSFGLIIFLSVNNYANPLAAMSQTSNQWSTPARIPAYANDTYPPILLTDQNKTIYAFASQQVSDAKYQIVITINQWTLPRGWTRPVAIILSPIKNEARLIGAFLDKKGLVHVIFFGGDNTLANVYYTQAPISDAENASAWSAPAVVGEKALNPECGGILGDADGNLVILYSGFLKGHGFYAIYSTDSGGTWSTPVPIFLTNSDALFPFGLHMVADQTGWIHAIWNTNSNEGQGRGIFYARLKLAEKQWSDPVELARTDSGYGTQVPSIIESNGTVFALYYYPSQLMMRISGDNGVTWQDPITPFYLVGNNGSGSFVTDSGGTVHLIWGQRIQGNPDIHGIWHSIWLGTHWSEPEKIISGPQVADIVGDQAFDPSGPQTIISQGNVLMATWRQDPGLKGNGVWYAYKILDTPELPAVPFPTPVVIPTFTTLMPTMATAAPTVITAVPAQITPTEPNQNNPQTNSNGTSFKAFFIGGGALILIALSVFIYRKYQPSRP